MFDVGGLLTLAGQMASRAGKQLRAGSRLCKWGPAVRLLQAARTCSQKEDKDQISCNQTALVSRAVRAVSVALAWKKTAGAKAGIPDKQVGSDWRMLLS